MRLLTQPHRWYTKGKGGGVKTWDARSDIFPHGLEYLAAKTGWPTQLHNRMWSPDTTYDKRNGGKYNFVNDGSAVVVPDDQQFWNDLVANKTLRGKGMFMYEQDWLDVEFDKSKSLGESATLGRTWMMQMNNGCANSNVTIQVFGNRSDRHNCLLTNDSCAPPDVHEPRASHPAERRDARRHQRARLGRLPPRQWAVVHWHQQHLGSRRGDRAV